jgi:hypothetical protein
MIRSIEELVLLFLLIVKEGIIKTLDFSPSRVPCVKVKGFPTFYLVANAQTKLTIYPANPIFVLPNWLVFFCRPSISIL